ncbi:UDP-2,4-diacetamido-2,4,6-trideoxy-beta-L-altropyranose hydrolase [Sphingobium sp. B2]|uniref:UDP-2,4-diacetamido-2,4, 6-trideoxy-beta-L-altropyranose hydrolase n=1 Tax=Sphingobium sp. B2 TaxID=2583228 RepID=UPI0011A92A0E|nr:UDP-2,4-diacetamido-2,4,6-trideoxy-beta-L-altropyranose hydrolase [Sphingobium sp. B2]
MLIAPSAPAAGCWHVALRVDAGLAIGTGHVMRCLTLADGLAAAGADIRFLCSDRPGHMAAAIRARGYPVTLLPCREPDVAVWSRAGQEADAAQCRAAICGGVDWLVVDHYALTAEWETQMRGVARHVMVIDDLANRRHDCDLLLDQTHGRDAQDYAEWVPGAAVILCGASYALLNAGFAAHRPSALARRDVAVLSNLLISLGGTDQDNVTGAVLTALAEGGWRNAAWSENLLITVVTGRHAPWLDAVRNQAAAMPVPTRVLCGVADMASLMTESDLAIGAAGHTSWERCCIGLPTIMIVIAENQRRVAWTLVEAGAALGIAAPCDLQNSLSALVRELASDRIARQVMTRRAAAICDGEGVRRVMEKMRQLYRG